MGGVLNAGVKFGKRGAMALVNVLRRSGKTQRHHGIPMFMGGVRSFNRLTGQIPYHAPAGIHKEFHRVLNQRLQEAGFPAQNKAFMKYLGNNPGRQREAFAVLRDVSLDFDARHGTNFTVAFDVNFLRGAFDPHGW